MLACKHASIYMFCAFSHVNASGETVRTYMHAIMLTRTYVYLHAFIHAIIHVREDMRTSMKYAH